MAAARFDVLTMVGLLEKTVPKNYEIGLEIIGKPAHFSQQMFLDQIMENIYKFLAEGIHTVVHGFSGLAVYTEGIADMRTTAGVNLLTTYIMLDHEIDAEYIHVHSGTEYRSSGNITNDEKDKNLTILRTNLVETQSDSSPCDNIGIENLPSPSMGVLI